MRKLNRPTIGDSLLNMGSRWAVVLCRGLSKPSSQESRSESYGSVKFRVASHCVFSDDVVARRTCAANPRATIDTLVQLVSDEDDVVRREAIANLIRRRM